MRLKRAAGFPCGSKLLADLNVGRAHVASTPGRAHVTGSKRVRSSDNSQVTDLLELCLELAEKVRVRCLEVDVPERMLASRCQRCNHEYAWRALQDFLLVAADFDLLAIEPPVMSVVLPPTSNIGTFQNSAPSAEWDAINGILLMTHIFCHLALISPPIRVLVGRAENASLVFQTDSEGLICCQCRNSFLRLAANSFDRLREGCRVAVLFRQHPQTHHCRQLGRNQRLRRATTRLLQIALGVSAGKSAAIYCVPHWLHGEGGRTFWSHRVLLRGDRGVPTWSPSLSARKCCKHTPGLHTVSKTQGWLQGLCTYICRGCIYMAWVQNTAGRDGTPDHGVFLNVVDAVVPRLRARRALLGNLAALARQPCSPCSANLWPLLERGLGGAG